MEDKIRFICGIWLLASNFSKDMKIEKLRNTLPSGRISPNAGKEFLCVCVCWIGLVLQSRESPKLLTQYLKYMGNPSRPSCHLEQNVLFCTLRKPTKLLWHGWLFFPSLFSEWLCLNTVVWSGCPQAPPITVKTLDSLASFSLIDRQ